MEKTLDSIQYSLRPLNQTTVLVVDDEEFNRTLLKLTLEEHFQVVEACGGKEALEVCLHTPPDLILMDVMMESMSGYEACRLLKQHPDTHHIPVIFVTAISSPEEESKCWESGGMDIIAKPVHTPTLIHKARAHLTLKLQGDALREMAYLDGLTSVYNRRYFDDYFSKQLNQAKRSKSPTALMLMDVDWFKKFNDHYGHQAGDDCLRVVAQTLKKTLMRPLDIVARYGGEEFACVLPDTSEEGAIFLAENILKNIRELCITHELSQFGHVTLSIGVAISLSDEMNVDELLALADQKLYQAKEQGRNCFTIATGPQKKEESPLYERPSG
ncbi:GGDEF domain-containing response regulator [Hahella ganghwensis]|uniref:GGDEF domain-containing response regulator n=1 Tax=Hahella ganghwensis TaxID=286420 RepID=UPI0003756111|nr:diguanylate cyclase [Hahella ganghwensis]